MFDQIGLLVLEGDAAGLAAKVVRAVGRVRRLVRRTRGVHH